MHGRRDFLRRIEQPIRRLFGVANAAPENSTFYD
jgi:hypothetical protein